MIHDSAYEARVAERKRNRIPLSKVDDEQIERNILFSVFLTHEQQEEVRRTNDYVRKRQLIVKYAREFAHGSDES